MSNTCAYCGGHWFSRNLRGGMICSGCGAPAPENIHVENLHSEPGFYFNLTEMMLQSGIISKNEARQLAGVSTETERCHVRE